MTENCCKVGGNVMILACSGGCNVGQLSNQAAVELTQEGVGKMFCLAGIGGRMEGFIRSARDVPSMVVIDGCSLGCARATMEQARVPMETYVVVTDLGIEKNKCFSHKPEEIGKVKDAVKEALLRSGLLAQ